MKKRQRFLLLLFFMIIFPGCRQEPNHLKENTILIPRDARLIFSLDIDKLRKSLIIQNILLNNQQGYMDELRKDILQLDPYYINSIYGFIDNTDTSDPVTALQFNINEGFGYPFTEYLIRGNRPQKRLSGDYSYYSVNGSSSKQMFILPSDSIVLIAGSEETLLKMIGVSEGKPSIEGSPVFKQLQRSNSEYGVQISGSDEDWKSFTLDFFRFENITSNDLAGSSLELEITEEKISVLFSYTAANRTAAEDLEEDLRSLRAETLVEQAEYLDDYPSFVRQLSSPEETRLSILRSGNTLSTDIELELSDWQSTFIGADRYLNSIINRKPKTLKKQTNIPFYYIVGPLFLPFILILLIYFIREQKRKNEMITTGMSVRKFEDEILELKSKQIKLKKAPRTHFTGDMRLSLNAMQISLEKIITTLQSHPERFSRVRRQLHYYLDTALKIMQQYSYIQNHSNDKTDDLKKKFNESLENLKFGFKEMLEALVSDTVLDLDTEMKVLDMRVSSDFDTALDDD